MRARWQQADHRLGASPVPLADPRRGHSLPAPGRTTEARNADCRAGLNFLGQALHALAWGRLLADLFIGRLDTLQAECGQHGLCLLGRQRQRSDVVGKLEDPSILAACEHGLR